MDWLDPGHGRSGAVGKGLDRPQTASRGDRPGNCPPRLGIREGRTYVVVRLNDNPKHPQIIQVIMEGIEGGEPDEGAW